MTGDLPKSLTERTYRTLRSDILSCKYPPGARLRIANLCGELDASLGAVREALSRLAAEGLVVSEAQKGFSVSVVSRKDLLDLTVARSSVEGICLTRAMLHGGVEWEAAIVAALHRLSRLERVSGDLAPRMSEDWAAAHAIFHAALVSACDSEWLLRIRAMLFEQSDRYRRLTAALVKEERDVDAEHQAIADAALARDAQRATALLEDHFRRTAEAASEIVDTLMVRPAARRKPASADPATARSRLIVP